MRRECHVTFGMLLRGADRPYDTAQFKGKSFVVEAQSATALNDGESTIDVLISTPLSINTN